jgi:DNA-binding transcriptional ArsR family regulator
MQIPEMYGEDERLCGISKQMNVLAQLICSRARAEIFRVLFGVRGGEVHLREIHRQTGFSVGTVRQDIGKLVELGVVTRREDGNRVYFSANTRHPLYPELRQLVLKTSGLTDVLRGALDVEGIRCAFVFGSMAAGTAGAESDIDLMIVGEIGLRKVSSLLSGVGTKLGREINPHVLSPAVFARRVREREHLVTSILALPILFIVGTPDELEAMGG